MLKLSILLLFLIGCSKFNTCVITESTYINGNLHEQTQSIEQINGNTDCLEFKKDTIYFVNGKEIQIVTIRECD